MSWAAVDPGSGDSAREPRREAVVALGELDADLSAALAIWSCRAACRGVGSAGFFGRRSGVAARARCGCCPVAEACLWWAMVVEEDSGYRFGLWGGTTPALRARMAKAAAVGYARGRLRAAMAGLADTTGDEPAPGDGSP
jgi:hypothetical protein